MPFFPLSSLATPRHIIIIHLVHFPSSDPIILSRPARTIYAHLTTPQTPAPASAAILNDPLGPNVRGERDRPHDHVCGVARAVLAAQPAMRLPLLLDMCGASGTPYV